MPFYNFLDDLSCQVAVRLLDLIIERDSKCVKALEGLANILEHGHETVRNPVKLSEIGHSLLDLAQDAGDKRTALRILFRVYKQPELMTDENFPVYRKKAYVVYEQVMNDQDMGADERKYAIRRVIRLYWQNRDVS
jgi:hypothetical protein